LVVVEGKKIAGIITERDILTKVTATGKSSERVYVKDIMTTKVLTITSDRFLDDAIHIMILNNIKKLPVVEGNQLVGIVTSTDIVANSSEVGEYFLID
jgi:CBS domain-containing protein